MKIAFLLYPTQKVKVDEDSSFWIMRELVRRGHRVSYFESQNLLWQKNGPHAFLTPARLDVKKGYLPSLLGKEAVDLSMMDCIFIRKEPPFDTGYLYALQLLETIKDRVFILNDPQGIAMANEKTFSLLFKRFAPESLVTENALLARKFIKSLRHKVVVKPLDDKGGRGIFSTSDGDKNLPSLLDLATDFGAKKILIQRFIPASLFGDKRILILNGKALGAFTRTPPASDFRANLSVGGSMHRASLTEWDRKLVKEMAGQLSVYGLWFVGIDVIGKYLTEVNVTSPAGIPEINHFNRTHLEQEVVNFIESQQNLFFARR